jgi:hypothetical protein
MPTSLTTDEMKVKVRSHFEDFVNDRKADVIRTNMTADFYDHDGPGEEPTDASGDEQAGPIRNRGRRWASTASFCGASRAT